MDFNCSTEDFNPDNYNCKTIIEKLIAAIRSQLFFYNGFAILLIITFT
jgi:hypothetical protein